MGHGRSWREDNGKGQIKDIEDIGDFVFYRYSGIFLQILCQKFIGYEMNFTFISQGGDGLILGWIRLIEWLNDGIGIKVFEKG